MMEKTCVDMEAALCEELKKHNFTEKEARDAIRAIPVGTRWVIFYDPISPYNVMHRDLRALVYYKISEEITTIYDAVGVFCITDTVIKNAVKVAKEKKQDPWKSLCDLIDITCETKRRKTLDRMERVRQERQERNGEI
jgi:hypothetical protein